MSERNTLIIDDREERGSFYVTPENGEYVAYTLDGEEMWPMDDSEVRGYKDDASANVERVEMSETPI